MKLCSIVEEIQVGEYSQLIFAPIDASVPDDAPLLPSGFRIMHLNGSKVSFTYQMVCLKVACVQPKFVRFYTDT